MTSASLRHIPSRSLHVSKPTWWLESRFHFSFADWFPNDASKHSFGALRVVNDDIVQPRAGFGTHPHANAEIFSYVLDGELSHKDSMGHKEALGRGSVQYLSAGTGITHSEMNDGAEPCRFIQVWFTPDARGHTPQYGSRTFQPSERRNRLLHLLGGSGPAPAWAGPEGASPPSPIRLHQDANVFVSEADAGKAYDLQLGAGRQLYLLCLEGELSLKQQGGGEQGGGGALTLGARDAAAVVGADAAPTPLSITTGSGGAHMLLMEMRQAR